MRLALGIEYDGRVACGWQTQPSRCGVQDLVEAALARIAAHPVNLVAAGRTDAGVHALAQVAHFDTDADRPLNAWVRGVNSSLPAGIAVLWAQPMPADFHARFGAEERRYRYLLLNHPVRPGLLAGRVGWHHMPLDVDLMAAGAALLTGRHDFSAFRAAECQAPSPVKDLREIAIRRHGDFIAMDFRADGFLHHMVRNLVGSLVRVGVGRTAPEWMAELLAGRDRTRAAPTFMPDGLYFAGVRYRAEFQVSAPSARVPWMP